MHFLQSLPRPLLRHKIIRFLIRTGLKSNPDKTTFNDHATAFLDLSDPEPRNVFAKGLFEPDFFKIASRLLPANGIFFDLGANAGLCSFGLIPSHPSSQYHLFEANEDLISLMKRSSSLHPKVSLSINHACITERSGKTRFFLEKSQSGQSHLATAKEQGIKVPNLVLDEYLLSRQIKHIDFMKMDLEGHELAALKGMDTSLQENMVKAIYLETMPENQSRYGLETNAPLLFLEKNGYRLAFCKEEDFGKSKLETLDLNASGGSFRICPIKASEYPLDHATDILALAPTMFH